MHSELKKAVPALILAATLLILGPKFLGSQTMPRPVEHQPIENQDAEGRTIMLHSVNWEFQPSTITLKKGENVSLHLMGISGNHGISIPGLGINESMQQGEMKLVKVPTDTPGRYEFFCNVPCGPGHSDMTGTIIIEE